MDKELETRLRLLARKWIAQARHPMRMDRPEERDLLIRCATQLQDELHACKENDPGPGPRRRCCPTRPGESHQGTCPRSVMNTGRWNE